MNEFEALVCFTGTMSVSGFYKLRQLLPLSGQHAFEHGQAPAAAAVAAIALDPVRDERGVIALGPVRTSEVGP